MIGVGVTRSSMAATSSCMVAESAENSGLAMHRSLRPALMLLAVVVVSASNVTVGNQSGGAGTPLWHFEAHG
jgi:hypothetical protein